MKHLKMTQRGKPPSPGNPKKPGKSDAAFNMWLQRGLHQMYDDVAQEPIPEELLKLIEDDKEKRKK